jgi:hypothetical protein
MARAHVPRQVVAVVAIASALVAIYVVVRAL